MDYRQAAGALTMKYLPLVLLILHAGLAVADDYGRLFFTPAQRATLDNARKQNIRVDIGKDNSDQAAEPVSQNISVNGLVKRSDGKSTIWLNNRTVTEQQATGVGIATRKGDNGVKLTVPESGHTIDLKVGQTVEVGTGTVAEGYEKGSLPTQAPPATQPAPASQSPADANKIAPPAPPTPAKPNPAP